MYRVNTSNEGKASEYRRLLGSEIELIRQDLAEPASDQLTIVRFKASQFENVIVDDVSLEVEGAEVGVNVRWLLSEIKNLVGRRAEFLCYLGIHRNNQVEIFRGRCQGQLVEPRGASYGFNPFFLPEGSLKTFGEEIRNDLNPRKHAIDDFLAGRPWKVAEPLLQWNGDFQ